MGRGAPNKKGLDYFPKMLNFYDDDKIFDLMDEYGPLGVTIYDVILTIVYGQGYYAELSKDKLSRMVIRKIGNKWVKNQKAVVQVIDYCAELGLLCKDLLLQNVITSEGIQKRYYKIAVKLMKRQLYNDKYWLLEKEEKSEPVLSAPKNRISSEENKITSAVNPFSSEESAIKEKETKRKGIYAAPPGQYFADKELDNKFRLYIAVRKSHDAKLCDEQIQLLIEELRSITDDPKEQLAIVNKAALGNWKSFYELSKGRKQKTGAKKPDKNKFNNFHQREYDYGKLEAELLNSQEGENE